MKGYTLNCSALKLQCYVYYTTQKLEANLELKLQYFLRGGSQMTTVNAQQKCFINYILNINVINTITS